MANNDLNVVTVSDLDESQFDVTNADKSNKIKLKNTGGNVDFSNLPTVGWKKGTKVLAVQDGNNVFMQASEDIFTDVVLSLTTAKNSVQVVTGNNEVVNLVAQVTNAGVNPAGNIRLVLSKPQLGTYSLGSPQLESQGATNFVQVSKTEYTVESLASGGVAKVTIPVTYSKQGSFTFGGQVTSTIDTNTSNNSKTVTISVTERVTETGGSYVPTQDCPLFTIRDEEYGVNLRTTSIWDKDSDQDTNGAYKQWSESLFRSINIYGDKKPLANRRFKLSNVEQIVLVSSSDYSNSDRSSSYKNSYRTYNRSSDSGGYSEINNYGSSIGFGSASFSVIENLGVMRDVTVFQQDNLPTGIYGQHFITRGFTFDKEHQTLEFDNSFTFNFKSSVNYTNVGSLVMYVKPKGSNCKWQVCVIKFTADFTLNNSGNNITHNSSLGDNVSFKYTGKQIKRNSETPFAFTYIDDVANWVGREKPADLDFIQVGSLEDYENERGNGSVVITIKHGTSGTFTLTATDNRLANVITHGEINTSYNAGNKTLTVTLNNPQPQNSVKIGAVEFKVVD